MAVVNYLRKRFMPQIWCPGCGHGIVMCNVVRAIDKLGLKKSDVVVVSGIGCSSRMPGYLDFHTMHTLHGRALAFATGVKLGKPHLKVIVPMGDGDAMAIGGNHLIHAARRNIDLTVIIMNNSIYGMTGGQTSPLTPLGKKSTTATQGSIEPSFDCIELCRGAGATFLARTTTYHAKEIIEYVSEAINHNGFSLVEVASQCPTYFGRKNKIGNAIDMMKTFRDQSAKIGSKKMVGNNNLISRGVFVKTEKPEYCDAYSKLQDKFNR